MSVLRAKIRMLVTSALPLSLIVGLASARPLSAQDPCGEWELHETLRIGSVDGEDALSSVMDLEIGPDGRAYVTQHFVPHVTVFRPDGTLGAPIGRAGQGPGEFEVAAMRLAWKADTLWVSDAYTGHFFVDGVEVRQVRFNVRLPSEGSRFRPGLPLADGSYIGTRGLSGDITSFYIADRLSLPRFSARGEIVDTIARVPQRMVVASDAGHALHPLDMPLDNRLRYDLSPDGTRVVMIGEVREQVRSASFDLIAVDLNGDTIMKRSIPYTPQPITPSDRDWLTEQFGAHMAGDFQSGPEWRVFDDATRERARRTWSEALDLPAHHPPVRRILAGHDGTIWLLRELDLPAMVDTWEIYDANGTFEGRVVIREGRSHQIPWYPRLNLLYATRREVWASTIDELDVPYIHRFRVDRSCRPR